MHSTEVLTLLRMLQMLNELVDSQDALALVDPADSRVISRENVFDMYRRGTVEWGRCNFQHCSHFSKPGPWLTFQHGSLQSFAKEVGYALLG